MLQFITHYTDTIDYLTSARLALEGGCRWVQLRMKGASASEILQVAAPLRQLCDAYQAKMILDDHVELVQPTGADGVHLGLQDMPIAQAREILGPQALIGGTANTFADVQRHYAQGADYIGCGPFRFTTTKEKLSPVLGLEGYRTLMEQMRAAAIPLPVVAIGGITASDIPAILQTGVSGIALSGTILRAPSPVEEMRKVIQLIEDHKIR